MLDDSVGKLFVYASAIGCRQHNLKPVSVAAKRIAKLLNLEFEVKTFREGFKPVYVYYKRGDNEAIPVYCSKNEQSDIEEICRIIKNMMFVLSFHPKHASLKQVRKEIMQFS